MQISILPEVLKIEVFLELSGRESSLVQTFCESCVHLAVADSGGVRGGANARTNRFRSFLAQLAI